jgi:hypothetical protein
MGRRVVGGVVVRPYEQLVVDVKAKAAGNARIAMDLSKVRKESEFPLGCSPAQLMCLLRRL